MYYDCHLLDSIHGVIFLGKCLHSPKINPNIEGILNKELNNKNSKLIINTIK